MSGGFIGSFLSTSENQRPRPPITEGCTLTPQLTKIVERAISCTFLPWLNAHQQFGPNQYAYSKQRGHKEALAVNVCCWFCALDDRKSIGLYCNYVSGTFDRVRRARLLGKLRASGLHPQIYSFLASWLDDRRSVIAVSGVVSDTMVLRDSVFQGAVLGPPLWDIFCADAKSATGKYGFTAVIFADDFNCWKAFDSRACAGEILNECKSCQDSLHVWGAANSVKFDPGKESFNIIHRRGHSGDDFRLVGLKFDSTLTMARAVATLAREAGRTLAALLRSRRSCSRRELINLYTAQILSYIESGTPGYYHAPPSVLLPLDRIQKRLPREVG